MKRRDFLQMAAATSAALLLPVPVAVRPPPRLWVDPRVVAGNTFMRVTYQNRHTRQNYLTMPPTGYPGRPL